MFLCLLLAFSADGANTRLTLVTLLLVLLLILLLYTFETNFIVNCSVYFVSCCKYGVCNDILQWLLLLRIFTEHIAPFFYQSVVLHNAYFVLRLLLQFVLIQNLSRGLGRLT